MNDLTPSGYPPHKLYLKVGCVVVILRNIYPKLGVVNGTRCKVLELHDEHIVVEPLGKDNSGRTFSLHKIHFRGLDENEVEDFVRIQFPVKLAYAMTVHKAQGQTFSRVGVYIDTDAFTHGLLYMAFSRVINDSNLFIEFNPIYLNTSCEQNESGNFIIRNSIIYDLLK